MSDRFGPNTAQVEAFLGVLRGLSGEQVESARAAWAAASAAAWAAARDAAWDAAWDADRAGAWVADRYAARYAARYAVRYAARDAALALVVRDLISQKHFDTLTAPMRAAGVNFDTLGDSGE